MSRKLEEFRVLAGLKPLPFPWYTKTTRKQLVEKRLVEYEIYVDSSGMASDDEGNKWQVDKWDWPEGTYHGNQATQLAKQGSSSGGGYSSGKMGDGEWKRWDERAGKLLIALMLKGRKTDFIKSIATKKIAKGYPPTYKQRMAWEKTEGYMNSTIAKLPRASYEVSAMGTVGVRKADAKTIAWFEERFDLFFYSGKTTFDIKSVLTKADMKKAAAAKKPGSSKSSVTSSGADQIDVIRKAMQKRSDPFLTTILKAMQSEKDWRKGVSKDTLKGIRHQLYKRGMRKEADLFR